MYRATSFIDSIGNPALVNKKRMGQYQINNLILYQSRKYRSAVATLYTGGQLKYLLIDIKTVVTCIRYKYH